VLTATPQQKLHLKPGRCASALSTTISQSHTAANMEDTLSKQNGET
jgi:hypothetical protein